MATSSKARWVAGVDGCRAGWVVVLSDGSAAHRARVVPDFAAVLALPEAPEVIAVDMPIGLLDRPIAGGRTCEGLARKLLTSRASSMFSAPTRAALTASRAGAPYQTVSTANRCGDPLACGLSKQTFNLLPKIDEVDRAMSPMVQRRVFEVHPELSFTEANGGSPMAHSKKHAEGRAERRDLLLRLGFGAALLGLALRGAQGDDLLDACIACWTADRIARGVAVVLPSSPQKDSLGLRMELLR